MEAVSRGAIVRVHNRGGTILIVFSAVLGILAILIATTGNGNSRWFCVALTGGLSLLCIHHRLIRRLRYLDLGDEIAAQYRRQRRVIQWSEIVFARVQSVDLSFRTKIPGVRIPTQDHWIELRMRDGSSLTANIEAEATEQLREFLKHRVTPDSEWLRTDRLRSKQSGRKFDRWAGVIFGMFLSGVGVFLANDCGRELIEGIASLSWPKAPVTQLTSGIDVKESVSDNKLIRTTTYSPVVRYTYRVDGKEYSGSRYSINPSFSMSRSTVENELKKIDEQSATDVYYDPNDPSISVLLPGCNFMTYAVSAVGCMTILAGMGYSLFKYSNVKEKNRLPAGG